MGYKVFISYKYSDTNVQMLDGNYYTTARNYVDKIQTLMQATDHLNKGEDDGEDLSDFQDTTIQTHLKDKIYDSSITVVLISKSMMDPYKREEDQWIPWEVAYSLRDKTRDGRTSRTNGMLAIALPDENGSYSYFIEEHYCRFCDTTIYKTNVLFKILRENMFNHKNPSISQCTNGLHGAVYTGEFSYIKVVEWDSFKSNINLYYEIASALRENMDNYNIKINVY
jgi:hypothetical protein